MMLFYRNFSHTLWLLATHVLLLCLLSISAYAGDISQQRWQFETAYQALKANNLGTFFEVSESLRDYPLYYFLRYSYLKSRLTKVDATEIETFLKEYGQTAFGEMLRQDWLKELARQGDWSNFVQWYTPQKALTLRCQYVEARMQTGQSVPEVLQEAKELWLSPKSQPDACNGAFSYLYSSALMNSDLVWERVRLAMRKDQVSLAGSLAKRLSLEDQAWIGRWQLMHKKPEQELVDFIAQDSQIVREIIIHGIKQLADNQFDLASNYWTTYQSRYAFTPQQIGETQRDLALACAKQEHPDALKWLKAINKSYLTEDSSAQRILFALKKQEWSAVADFTNDLPEESKKLPQWRYWQGRAFEQTGKVALAQSIYKELANERDYYAFLAADRIGAGYQMQNKPTVFTSADEAQLLKNLSIKAALEFYQTGMTSNGRQEWQHGVKQLPPAQQMSAAVLANRWGWYDRAITTAAKANAYDDLEVRFPLPYRENLTMGASSQAIDVAWVYGIVRQESIFMSDARSQSGALGLMQLMPATARGLSKKVGVKISSNSDIQDIDTNITLGTAYLRQMLDKFDGNYMLATAAYNAGPGRAQRWAEENSCVPADIWVEMIPFDETRTYVRRVLFFTSVYEARLGQQPRPLRLALTPDSSCPIEIARSNSSAYPN
ncbi:MAG: hypothetical protein BWK79_06310 [Beggiatoa sp. IS2]|nr:MAG: hypothetical protein BWK79_06310 [Beggiatoa sp. IS2]